ncbi:hypothetical protein JCGZ_16779 [Jatropha curcas]|uniref:Uncharacterized protein n=2 Tax=Jatropha curcas TaxID=180498 RepID=A0A067L4Y9_JATCU|nr:hypothetical protein JCGZ_16779 [Jatropha curcas]
MVYDDHETRVGAHRIFSIVLVPSSVCPRGPAAPTAAAVAASFTVSASASVPIPSRPTNMQRMLSRTVSVFSSSAALFEKLKKEENSSQENSCEDRKEKITPNEGPTANNPSMLNRLKSSYSRAYSVKRTQQPVAVTVTADETPISKLNKEQIISLRLSSRQITLLLSSIWAQSLSPLNTPVNYEAIAHSYSLVLLFARTKNSSNETLIRSFQLAFSLRGFALGGGPLQPSRRRSLFILSTSMIIFSSKAFNILPLVSCARATITDKTVDPFLKLVDECKLQAVINPTGPRKVYGSKEDNEDALKSLAAIEITDSQTKESFANMIAKFTGKSSKQDSALKEQLLKDFVPDDVCPLGADLFMEILEERSEPVSEHKGSEKAEPLLFSLEDNLPNATEGQNNSGLLLGPELPVLLSVGELLTAVSETTYQVGRFSASTPNDMPYKEMAGQCEALTAGKQKKMSDLMSSQEKQENMVKVSAYEYNQGKQMPSNSQFQQSGNPFLDENFNTQFNPASTGLLLCASEFQYHQQFQLPASSPYDNFLRAAGC